MACECKECGADYPARRAALGYRLCLACGEQEARAARTTWCIAPAGHKQGYTLITDPQYLRNMNPKHVGH